MNEFKMILEAMEKLHARDNPVYAKRVGRSVGMTGKEVGYILRQMRVENQVILVDLSAKKWTLP